MLASILASGLAAGAIYALVGVTYNTMFSASRVMSFTAGQLAMLGGVFGSWFMLRLGMPLILGFLLTLAGCAIIGVITEFVAVRPVLKSLEQHLYVLSTLALALIIQQVTAIKWGTEPQPFPRLFGLGSGVWDEKFWLPVVACAATIIGLEYLYRRTLVGHAFLAIAEDNFAARALGLPERNLRIASYALAGVIGGIAARKAGDAADNPGERIAGDAQIPLRQSQCACGEIILGDSQKGVTDEGATVQIFQTDDRGGASHNWKPELFVPDTAYQSEQTRKGLRFGSPLDCGHLLDNQRQRQR